jgi:hypothetical protein
MLLDSGLVNNKGSTSEGIRNNVAVVIESSISIEKICAPVDNIVPLASLKNNPELKKKRKLLLLNTVS